MRKVLYLRTHPLFSFACYVMPLFVTGQTTWGLRKCVDFLIALWEAAVLPIQPGLITDQMRRMTMKQFYFLCLYHEAGETKSPGFCTNYGDLSVFGSTLDSRGTVCTVCHSSILE